jgi:hypothetical protein
MTGWPLWTAPELSFEKKQLIPVLQELLYLIHNQRYKFTLYGSVRQTAKTSD